MRFTLLTYNIHKAIGLDRRFRPERIAEVLAHHDADIVLLQEVDRGAPRSQHIDLAGYFSRTLVYAHRAVGMNVFLRKGRYGNATLSRFPIGRQRNIDLTVGWLKRRGAQHACIHVPVASGDFPIEIFNVHLGLSARERKLQLCRLFAAPDFSHIPADRACIIAGDMNDWRGLLRAPFFSLHGFACATDRGAGTIQSIKTFPSFAPTGGLDKVYFRGPLRLISAHTSRLKIARIASDHLPVIVEFETFPTSAGGGVAAAPHEHQV